MGNQRDQRQQVVSNFFNFFEKPILIFNISYRHRSITRRPAHTRTTLLLQEPPSTFYSASPRQRHRQQQRQYQHALFHARQRPFSKFIQCSRHRSPRTKKSRQHANPIGSTILYLRNIITLQRRYSEEFKYVFCRIST